MPAAGAICYVDGKATNCPSTTAHKGKHKVKDKPAPFNVGGKVHSKKFTKIGRVNNHEHKATLLKNNSAQPVPHIVKKSKPVSAGALTQSVKHHKMKYYHQERQHTVQQISDGLTLAHAGQQPGPVQPVTPAQTQPQYVLIDNNNKPRPRSLPT